MGRAMILASRYNANWVTPVNRIEESTFQLSYHKLYEYHAKPPKIRNGNQWPGIKSLKEWGILPSPDSDECILLKHLEEFQSTDFCIASHSQRLYTRNDLGEEPLFQHPVKRASESELRGPQPVKRLKLVTSSIVDWIPQPHFIPSRGNTFGLLDTTRLPPFSKVHPIAVPPYTALAVSELLESQYRRGAWLIPIRGQMPFEEASMAVIVQSPKAVGLDTDYPHLVGHKIVWTPEILVDFWNFLLGLQRSTKLGPISLSFHPAPSDMIFTASEPIEESTNNPYHQFHQHSSRWKVTIGSSPTPSDGFAPYVYRARLEAVDYIKVYHDIPYSLSLRNVLDAYQYKLGDASTACSKMGDSGNFRVLKGARLAFMDERSKVAFMM
ncbi:hypothetical protein ID866_4387 [Astraeus odoratus]|nr:hypothetical protein ID866_4387 [Astraeus odoratus]